jgi:hypothetical protein
MWSVQEHCVNAFRNSGSNLSFPTKSCTCASILFLAGIIPWSVDGTTLLGKTMCVTSHLHLVCIVQPRCNYTAPESSCPVSKPYSQSERVTLSWTYKRMLAQHGGETCANGRKGLDVAEQMWVTKDFQPIWPIQQWWNRCIHGSAYQIMQNTLKYH